MTSSTFETRSTGSSRARLRPVLAAVGMALVTLLLWWFADARESDRIRRLIDSEADSVAARLEAHLELLTEAVERSALRWSRLDALTTDAAAAESALLLRDPAISSVLWLDARLALQYSYGPDAAPVPGQVEEWLRSTRDPGWSEALRRGRARVSRPLVGPGGIRSFLVIAPLTLRSGPAGLMATVVDLEEWVRSITVELGTRLNIAVRPHGLSPVGAPPPAGALRNAESRDIARDDLRLRALVWPTPATLAALRSPLPGVVLIGGLVFAVLLGVAIRLATVEGQRVQDRRMARALRREIEARRSAETQLAARARALERSNADLTQFARLISHDLRDPLNVIDMHLQLIRDAGSPEAVGRHVTKARKASERMVEMIDGLLAYSRVGGGDPDERADTTRCAERAVGNLESALRKSEARVKIGDLPVVRGPSDQITQLFQNLIGNAVRHRDEEPPRVEVSAERRSRHWLFQVKDNGPGIPAELTDRIFELFERGERSGGTGVGLAACRRLVEAAGGRIWVQSRPGEGSVFCFTWPAGSADPDGSTQPSSSGSPASR